MYSTPHLSGLIFAIKVASWDAERQVSWIERTGFHVDEIALQIGDLYNAVKYNIQGEGFPDGVEQGIVDVLTLFDSMSSPGSGLWSVDALFLAAEWDVVRGKGFFIDWLDEIFFLVTFFRR
ncbi:hypothetical protein Q7689_06325 [Nocardiopsis tropica]|uniref:hypothetical protein n=1 Tax=Nocardiopsis tropica TaxID=109330 RepID=UPI002E83AC85|nr:hypothetical protein [Nocardiopsis tropica]